MLWLFLSLLGTRRLRALSWTGGVWTVRLPDARHLQTAAALHLYGSGWSLGQPRPNGAGAKVRGLLHSKERDREATNYHYDRSNDFFALWLDTRMIYSCAYFATPDDDLETAQEHKMEYLCRKLRLRPGERLLDIGCGWGGLLIYAAQHYGVEAEGITLSPHQAELARERIKKAGLEKRCRVNICDYREVNKPQAYDKLVSVSMAEHIGKASLPTYFKSAWEL